MAKKNEEETDYIDYGEVKIDPETADVAFVDPSVGEEGVQVVISANPDNPAGCSVAVLTASHGEDVEEEELLGFGVIDPDEPDAGGAGGEGGSGDGDEAKKTAEARKAEARKNFNERWAAKRAERAEAKKKEEAKKTEERRQACEAAKQKFRAKGKKA